MKEQIRKFRWTITSKEDLIEGHEKNKIEYEKDIKKFTLNNQKLKT
jgi:hypothetical protein